jgi:hypothetical protein
MPTPPPTPPPEILMNGTVVEGQPPALAEVHAEKAVQPAVEPAERQVRQSATLPASPEWHEYPGTLTQILETMVVTRYKNVNFYPESLEPDVPGRNVIAPLPGLYKKFDCVRHPAFNKTTQTCKTLLCSSLKPYVSMCDKHIGNGTLNVASGVFVAFFGSDTRLSTVQSTVRSIGSHFQRTYFEGYDIAADRIDVLPIGFQEQYLRFQDWDAMVKLSQQNTISKEMKVLGAFGMFWRVKNPSRISAGKLCSSHVQDTWLSCGRVPRKDWWSKLSTYSFMLNPTGNGVQSPKFYEALLMRTIPICTMEPAFIKLEEKGWPIVLVHEFSEVAALNLTQKYAELAPRLQAIHKYLFLDQYWKYLRTGGM